MIYLNYKKGHRSQAHKYKILVVDDQRYLRRMFVNTLSQIGYAVEESENGKKALQQIKDSKPDLIFMDITMPEMDGFEATERIREMPEFKDVVIIMISAFFDTAFVKTALNCGANDFLVKPFQPDEMIKRVQKYLY